MRKILYYLAISLVLSCFLLPHLSFSEEETAIGVPSDINPPFDILESSEAPLLMRITVLQFNNYIKSEELKNVQYGLLMLLRRDLFCVKGLSIAWGLDTAFENKIYSRNPEDLASIGEKLGVDALIIGELIGDERNLTIKAQVFDVRKKDVVASAEEKGSCKEIPKLEKRIVPSLLENLRISLSEEEKNRIAFLKPIDHTTFVSYSNALYFSVAERFSRAYSNAIFTIGLSPDFSFGYKFLGDIKNGEAAINYYYKAIELDPYYSEAYWATQLEYKEAGLERRYMDLCIKLNKAALTISPNYGRARLSLGSRYTTLDRYDEALAETLKANLLIPRDELVYFNLGAIYACLKRYDEAVINYKKAMEFGPDVIRISCRISSCLTEMKKYEEAIDFLKTIIKKHPRSCELYVELGNVYYAKGDANSAIEMFQKSLDINPTYAAGYCNLGLVKKNLLEDFDGAIADYLKAIMLDPDDALTYNNLGVLYKSTHRMEEAKRCLEMAVQLKPEVYFYNYNLADTYRDSGEFDKAILIYNKLIELYPKRPCAYTKMGLTYQKKNEFEKAKEYYNKTLSLPPTCHCYEESQEGLKIISLIEKKQIIKDWLIVGPFDNTDKKGFTVVYEPEKVKVHNIFATYAGIDNKKVKWIRPFKNSYGLVELDDIIDPSDYVAIYALSYIVSPSNRKAQFKVGSDDTITIWLNGKKIHSNEVYRGVGLDQDIVNVALKKGANKVLFKICEGWGYWSFYFRVTDMNGEPFTDLSFRPYRYPWIEKAYKFICKLSQKFKEVLKK